LVGRRMSRSGGGVGRGGAIGVITGGLRTFRLMERRRGVVEGEDEE
jgi:hypothetical protein